MIQCLGRRVIVEPVLERPSSVIEVPARASRWKNDGLTICGRVVALGRTGAGLEIGQYVYHSDSCALPVQDGELRSLHEDDIMFVSDTLVPTQWVGAEESYDG